MIFGMRELVQILPKQCSMFNQLSTIPMNLLNHSTKSENDQVTH